MKKEADAGGARGARNLVVTRLYDAPRALVFAAWTSPERIARWWGPRGFTTTTRSMDIRPGGEWRFVMHGPDGRDYQNRIRYLEVAEPKRLVYEHDGGEDVEPVQFHVTVTFAEEGGQTRITLDMEFPTAEELARVEREYGAREGGRQTLERLGEFLPEISGGADFVISRRFAAPRARVWQAWTDRDQLMRWWGPKGFRMLSATLDLRPGGMFHYGMRAPDGSVMWGRFLFREIAAPELLVYINSFSDPEGGVTRHPWSADWPIGMLSRVDFAEDGGGTLLTIRWRPHEASEAERRVFGEGHGSMRRGWTGTLDQLEAHLAAGG